MYYIFSIRVQSFVHGIFICLLNLYFIFQAIQDLAKPSKGSWCYRSDYCKLIKPEPLSSWPLGYKVHGPSFKEFILDTVRREIECYDQFYGFLLFGSVSGFVSSGINSYITELIRNEFPTVSLANIVSFLILFCSILLRLSLT